MSSSIRDEFKRAGFKPKPRPQFKPTIVKYFVRDAHGKKYHQGSFKLHDDTERRAFGERCNEALAAGHTVTTTGEPA